MATLTPTPPAPAKPVPPRARRPVPPDDRDPGQPLGPAGDSAPYTPPARRRSVWPFLVDLGLVMALFGLIITGRPLIVIGGLLFVFALVGWLREARAEYRSLAD